METAVERRISEGMAKKKKTRKEETYDSFDCTVDSWRRDYSFGIDRFPVPWKETDQAHREMDHLVVMGTVVSHDTNRKPNRRKFKTVELNLFPTHTPRDKWRKDLDAVGAAWTEKGDKGKLHGTIHIAADVFYSLFPCLAINHFRELRVKVLNLHYTKGTIDEFSLDMEKFSLEFSD
jgi:hypothetical protein